MYGPLFSHLSWMQSDSDGFAGKSKGTVLPDGCLDFSLSRLRSWCFLGCFLTFRARNVFLIGQIFILEAGPVFSGNAGGRKDVLMQKPGRFADIPVVYNPGFICGQHLYSDQPPFLQIADAGCG